MSYDLNNTIWCSAVWIAIIGFMLYAAMKRRRWDK